MKTNQGKSINKTLREVFGLEKLRPGQREIIEAVLRGEDVLALMPTGAGKSLCYQLPALALEGMTLVVSPLISLMKDQTDKLAEIGLEAANLNSSVRESEQQEALEQIEKEASDFIFTTPERLADEEFLRSIVNKTFDFVVIDEAHCISSWGHDFRPAFLGLRESFRALKNPPVLALTATATPEVVDDIKKQLDRPAMRVVRGGIYRPNLHFAVAHTTNDLEKRQRLAALLGAAEGAKIVYCATVKAVEEVAENLKSSGFDAAAYHGKLSAKQRTDVQDRFMAGELDLIVATNAFGMGVDKPDIRAVVHWQMPGSLEAYYQEAGRAGRDGLDARCTLIYDTRDRRVQQYFLGGRYPSADDCAAVYRALETLRDEGDERPKMAAIVEALGGAVSKNKLRVGLNLFKDEGVVRERRGARFELVRNGLSDAEIAALAESYVERGASDREKLERMMLYAQSTDCRWRLLARYFLDETEAVEHCGTCDNCAAPLAEKFAAEPPAGKMTAAEEAELLAELRASPQLPELAIGQAVELPKLGAARVAALDGDKIDVVLENGETRTFKREFVRPAD